MSQISPKLRRSINSLVFWCPGCEETHVIDLGKWQWDGNLTQPTFAPSVLVTSGHFIVGSPDPTTCWCTYNREHPDNPAPFRCQRCHTYVREGRIQFLPDSTHALAGQTIDLPDLPAHLQDPPA